MKIFIIGDKHNSQEFNNAEILLRQNGHVPINPVKLLQALPEEINNSDFTVIVFEIIRVCDAVYLLNGWEKDLFAAMEVSHAKRMEKEFIDEITK